jgi:hypothetical protein
MDLSRWSTTYLLPTNFPPLCLVNWNNGLKYNYLSMFLRAGSAQYIQQCTRPPAAALGNPCLHVRLKYGQTLEVKAQGARTSGSGGKEQLDPRARTASICPVPGACLRFP